MEYVLGIAQNPRLKRSLAPEMERARQECERTGQAARVFKDFRYRTLDSEFCVLAVEEALETHPAPEIFNTDQGSQFTAQAFTGCLEGAGVRISMDGRGRCMDNVFIERLWRSLKYEAVYLQDLADGFAARSLISEWMTFYNLERPHSALGGRTPWEALQERGGVA